MVATRRPGLVLLALALALGFVALLATAPGAGAAPKGFKFGVASGDVSKSSAILWARANRGGFALVQLQKGGKFEPCDVAGAPKKFKVKAVKSNDFTVQKKVGGLKAGHTYRYRWCMEGGKRSAVGRFDTAPAANQAKTIRFSVTGDQDAAPLPGSKTPYWNDFGVWRQIKAEENDFNVMMGDTIYSDSEVPGVGGVTGTAVTVAQKWAKYRMNLGQKPWAGLRGATSYYAHWDDHEFINDFARSEDVFPEEGGNVVYDGEALYENGAKAFRNYNPITYSTRDGIYRSFRWGKNLQIFFLDERSFRSSSADYGGACDNPAGSGSPDLAPTAPPANRALFSVIAPQLALPAPPACVAAINDPNRTMLGEHQLEVFENAVKSSTATFKVIMNEVPIQQFYALPYDRWEGYAAERTQLLTFLRDNVKNVVFLTTDVHANMVNDARLQTLEAGGPVNTGITEVTTGPVATKTFAGEINSAVGSTSAATSIRAFFFNAQPPTGVGMQCSGLDQFSYAQVSVGKTALTVNLKDIEGKPVQNSADRNKPAEACPPIVIPAQ
ncbi:MAG: alkaline phosphatase D family protein [Solirubrobacterales bacterium]